MAFQTSVPTYSPKAELGGFASMNPTSTVDAGGPTLTAGSAGLSVAKFAWQSVNTTTGAGVANSYSPTAPVVPDGFVANEMQALITAYLTQAGMQVPAGSQCTLFQRGDFWAQNPYGDSSIGQKVFANLFSGDILAAATGSFPTTEAGANASVTATITAGSYTLAAVSVTSGTLEIGQLINNANFPPSTYLESGSGATWYTTQAALASAVATTITSTANPGVGGGVVSSATAASVGATALVINTLTSGVVVPGQLVQGTGIATGTYVSAIPTGGFNGTSGTITLSAATTATISASAVNFSAFIETPWYVNSFGNAGDLIKIGIRN